MHSTSDPSRDSKALAAYVLGYRARTLWVWHKLFWTYYFIDECTIDADSNLENGPWLAAEELECARFACRDFIPSKNYVDILDIARHFQTLPERTIASWRHMEPGQRKDLSQSDPPDGDKWERLQGLV